MASFVSSGDNVPETDLCHDLSPLTRGQWPRGWPWSWLLACDQETMSQSLSLALTLTGDQRSMSHRLTWPWPLTWDQETVSQRLSLAPTSHLWPGDNVPDADLGPDLSPVRDNIPDNEIESELSLVSQKVSSHLWPGICVPEDDLSPGPELTMLPCVPRNELSPVTRNLCPRGWPWLWPRADPAPLSPKRMSSHLWPGICVPEDDLGSDPELTLLPCGQVLAAGGSLQTSYGIAGQR